MIVRRRRVRDDACHHQSRRRRRARARTKNKRESHRSGQHTKRRQRTPRSALSVQTASALYKTRTCGTKKTEEEDDAKRFSYLNWLKSKSSALQSSTRRLKRLPTVSFPPTRRSAQTRARPPRSRARRSQTPPAAAVGSSSQTTSPRVIFFFFFFFLVVVVVSK